MQIVIKDKVLELLMYFTNHQDEEVQIKALIGLGSGLKKISNKKYVSKCINVICFCSKDSNSLCIQS